MPDSALHSGRSETLGVLICFRSLRFDRVLGGAEVQSLRLCGMLNATGHTAAILAGRPGWSRRWHPLVCETVVFDNQPVPMIWVETPPLPRLGGVWFMLWAAFYLLFRSAPYQVIQVISIRLASIMLAGAARIVRKRVVCRLQGELYFSREGQLPLPDDRANLTWLGRLYLAALRIVHMFITQNHDLTARLVRLGIEPQRVIHIANGVDTKRFAPLSADEKQELRQRLKLPTDGTIICCTSRFNYLKRVDVAVDAFARIAPTTNCMLLLVGGGEQEMLLRTLVAQHGLGDRVLFQGFVNNPFSYLQVSDLFVLPSDHEAHANALIEAMACALPVVATAVGGNLDTIQDGVNGLLVPAADIGMMASAFSRVLDNPMLAADLGAHARDSVLASYTLPSMVQRYIAVYQHLVN